MDYDIMKDLRRIIRRRSREESPQARNDRISYYAGKWHAAFLSGDPALRMCSVMILAALDAPEILTEWQRTERYYTRLLELASSLFHYTNGTDPE